jgi:diguanylate cyclase (GGDEF)-like protein
MADTSAYVDELSGVYNRAYREKWQRTAAAELVLKRIPFSVVMVAIDHFKGINDAHGRLIGGEVIEAFGSYLQAELRKSDTIIRYGDDEFVCFTSNTH